MKGVSNQLAQHKLHSAVNVADERGTDGEPHGGEFVSVNNNLNFKRTDEKVINRIQIETNSPVIFSAGILRFKNFSFLLVTLYLRSSVGMNEEAVALLVRVGCGVVRFWQHGGK